VTISPSSSATQAQKALGARLREIRKDAGLSGRALALATGQHFTRVSKIENGVQAPSDKDIRDWCRACAAEPQIPDLIATARAVESAYLELRRQARAGMRRVLGAHTTARYERTSMFRIYEHNVIPGLFQTAAYSTAMLSFWIGFLDVPNDIDAAVAARMAGCGTEGSKRASRSALWGLVRATPRNGSHRSWCGGDGWAGRPRAEGWFLVEVPRGRVWV
jgi:transcriptional regulator with XRE-family HTH domain